MSKELSSFDEFKTELRGLLEKHNVYVFVMERNEFCGHYYIASSEVSFPVIEIGDLMQQVIENK